MKPSATSTTNPVEQLKLLRSFVSDPTNQTSAYTEHELFECLKYSGYNVERAAELLMTGQYATIIRRLNHQPQQRTTNSSRKSNTQKSAFFHSTTTSPIKSKTKKNITSSTGSTTSIVTATTSTKGLSRKQPPSRVSMTPPIPSIETNRKNIHDVVDVISLMDDHDEDSHQNHTANIHQNLKVLPRKNNDNDVAPGPYLLCQRWISNAIITSRHGGGARTNAIIRYRERFMMDYTQTGYSIIKFRTLSSNSCSSWKSDTVVEGRLPENIAQVLIPFLRYPQQEKQRQSDDTSSSSSPIITVELESMMEETNVIIGSTIPIQIRIYIHAVQDFFHIISSASISNSRTDAKHYFQRQPNSVKDRKNKFRTLPLHEAAFLLFQWAQYGDVPVFDDPIPNVESSNNGKKPSSTTKAKHPMGIVAEECNGDETGEKDDESADDDHDDDDEHLSEINDEELDKEDAEFTEINHNKSMEMLTLSPSSSLWTDALPDDMSDPRIFQQCNISLRPYQKQALYFMMQRETVGMTREQLNDQLQILNELIHEQQNDKNHASLSLRNQQHQPLTNVSKEVTCDCGPVLVDEIGQQKSKTLGGEINPIGHPLWQRRYLASEDMKHSITVFVNELLGIVTHVPPQAPKHCSGGILADAMGLGKTVMLLALILKSKEGRSEQLPVVQAKNISPPPTATLVVAKLSLLPQWEAELKTKTNLTYKVYYGSTSGKPTNSFDFLRNVDVVITTYGTIQSELRLKHPVLLQCDWLRVILDEAHCIRNHRTLASKACCQLKTQHRWCVTGTIIQNSLDDVYGIMKFLQHEPWCLSSFWNTAITQIANNNNIDKTASDPAFREKSLQTAIDRIRRILSPIMIRRTKDSLTKDGQPILTLPPIESRIVKVNLSDSEREFYNAVLARSLEVFDGFIKDGTAAKAYFQIFSLLSRLRQSCDHIALTVKSKIGDDKWMSSTNMIDVAPGDMKLDAQAKSLAKSNDTINNQFLNNLLKKFYDQQETSVQDSKRSGCDVHATSAKRMKAQNYISSLAKNLSQTIEDNATHMDDECPICLDRPKIESAVLTPCGHIFCRRCLVGAIRSQSPPKETSQNTEHGSTDLDSTCPTCQEKFQSKRIIGLSDSMEELNKVEVLPQEQSQKERSIRDNPFVIARQILNNAVSGTESSKMRAIMDELNEIWKLDPGSKVLMFSHYLGFLDLLGAQFNAKGIPYFRLDGSLNIRERMHVLEEFRTSTTPKATPGSSTRIGTVLLMSMSAGGEGLNIVSASSCFILEPWWNSAKEDQCQNRIHRFGQTAALVRVRKFIVNDSVEERIVELQQRKAYVAGEIYNDTGHNTATNMESARLSLEDFRLIFRR